MRFASFTRTHLGYVRGRPTLRAFRAAVSVCGLPHLRVYQNERPSGRWLELGLQFMQGDMFRCDFTVKLVPLPRYNWVWFRKDGQPRALKPSRWDNPLSSKLNASLVDGDGPRDLYLWERVLLALGF